MITSKTKSELSKLWETSFVARMIKISYQGRVKGQMSKDLSPLVSAHLQHLDFMHSFLWLPPLIITGHLL